MKPASTTSRPAAIAAALALTLFSGACNSSPKGASTSSTTSTAGSTPGSGNSGSVLPRIGHVFVIMVENEGYVSTFGNPANDPYLATTLVGQGALLQNYFGIGHFSMDNYDAIISGQAPNKDTQADCVAGFTEFPPGAGQVSVGSATGLQDGVGCVYPAGVQTLASQLHGKGLTWKGYMEDMGNNPQRDGAPTSTCGHPALNGPDGTLIAASGDGYADRHDPFIYFHSIIDNAATCSARVVPLGSPTGAMPASDTTGATGLASDLKSTGTTPNFSFISPNLCNDGHDYPCTNETAPGTSELSDIDAFLQTWVPLITGSPAFQKDGLLMITFDEGDNLDTTACCNEQPGPTGVPPGGGGPGGGRIGSVLISPFIKPGTVVTDSFNHYGALASFEDIFGVARLGFAQSVPEVFGKSVFTNAQ